MKKTKVCKKCGKRKRMTSFAKQKACRDGLKTWCRGCAESYNEEYYLANRVKLLDRANLRYWAGKEKQNGSE